MTERTVTIQTEQEETITLCDHCGLSDDAGEIINYGPWENEHQGEYDHLHLHRECLDDMGVNVPEGKTFGDVYTETTNTDSTAVFTLDSAHIAALLVSGVFFLSIPIVEVLVRGRPINAGIVMFTALFGIVLSWVIWDGYYQTQKTIDEIRNNE